MLIHVKQLPCPEAEFRTKLNEYLAARKNHAETVGVPAPFPPFEIMRTIAESGGNVDIYGGDEPPPPDDTPAPLKTIVALESMSPFTHRSLREFFIGFGEVNTAFQQTLLYKRAKAVDDLIRAERAKL